MIRYGLAITIVLASWATTASSAIECRAELPPAAKEYWSWRIIDGKRCWYPGRPGLSKANLHWPLSEPGQIPPRRTRYQSLLCLRRRQLKTCAMPINPTCRNCRSQNGGAASIRRRANSMPLVCGSNLASHHQRGRAADISKDVSTEPTPTSQSPKRKSISENNGILL